ncbi:MAG: hypothetical protein K9N48_05565 [Verrucomicrobia bacterium]|nr:hypothetical protein [Verrucomicrobiota bacterium]MCF7708306.1 hypothetical protein [Verrucomicrobiota bacterium]
MKNDVIGSSKEKTITVFNGWPMLILMIALILLGLYMLISFFIGLDQGNPTWGLLWASVIVETAGWLITPGFFTLQPNESRGLILFGAYVGIVRRSGFHWTNPLNKKIRVSLRARNLNGPKLKVIQDQEHEQ